MLPLSKTSEMTQYDKENISNSDLNKDETCFNNSVKEKSDGESFVSLTINNKPEEGGKECQARQVGGQEGG